jgi:UDP-N-acetyl-D-galactosamine dehydrogenase
VAQRLVKMLIGQGFQVKGARIGVLGLTFKEDCNDLRNSKVPDILAELRQFGIDPLIHDSRGNPAEAKHEYGVTLNQLEEFKNLDGLIVAVSHKEYVQLGQAKLLGMVRDGGCFVDVKSVFSPAKIDRGIQYWSL